MILITCGFTLQALKTPYSPLTRHETATRNSNPQNNGGGTVVLPIVAATATVVTSDDLFPADFCSDRRASLKSFINS